MTDFEHRFFAAAAARAESLQATKSMNIVAMAHHLFRNANSFWCGSTPDIADGAEFRTGLIRALRLRRRGVRCIN